MESHRPPLIHANTPSASAQRLENKGRLENRGSIDVTGDNQILPGGELLNVAGSQMKFFDGGSGTPGNSPGTFTVIGNYTQLESRRLLIELASASSFDLLSVSDAVALSGRLAVALDGGFLPEPADTFIFLTAANISGAFSNAPDGSRLFTSDGLGSFLVSYDPDSVSLSHYVAIPEPSAVGLLLLTGTAAAFRRRRGVQNSARGRHVWKTEPPPQRAHFEHVRKRVEHQSRSAFLLPRFAPHVFVRIHHESKNEGRTTKSERRTRREARSQQGGSQMRTHFTIHRGLSFS